MQPRPSAVTGARLLRLVVGPWPPYRGVAPPQTKPGHETARGKPNAGESPPELWAECSDAASLARHLDQFGEIRITRLEPETAVAWEGEHTRHGADRAVRLGTKVILTAEEEVEDAAPTEPRPHPAPAPNETPVSVEPPVPWRQPTRRRTRRVVEPERATRAAFRVRASQPAPVPAAPRLPARPRAGRARSGDGRTRRIAEAPPEADPAPPEPMSTAEPEPVSTTESVAEPPATVVPDAEAALAAALDSLGQAHHRPYSRA